MTAYVPKYNPKNHTNPLVGSAAYTWEDLGCFHDINLTKASPELVARLQDQRSEHRLSVKKVKLTSKFSNPKITNFNTLSNLNNHYTIKKALKMVATNY